MDRPLDPELVRGARRRRGVLLTLAVAGIAAVFGWGTTFLRASVDRAAIRTARVDRGPVEAAITASGTVIPEVEVVLTSPVDARVLRILKRPGAAVKKGEPILELDLQASRLAVEKLTREGALKDNQQVRTRLALENTLNDLESRREIKRLQLESNKAQLARHLKLQEAGLLSVETLRQSELAEAQARIELAQIEGEAKNARESTRAELEGLALETATLRNDRDEARRQLDLGTTRADRDGVLTWTVSEEGGAVRKNDVIARLADLRSFRVEASVSDLHARILRPGLPTVVRVGEERLEGTVAEVRPTIQNGAMTFSVNLVDRSSPLLKSNLRVDVDVITDRKESALRLKRGAAVGGAGSQDVFVVREGRALRTPVRLGLASFERVEVVEGLKEGDEVIVSEVGAYAKAPEIRLR